MSNNIKNITKSISNILSAATGTVAAATELAADITGAAASAITSTPAVSKALLMVPVSAYQGVLEESGGLTAKEAKAISRHYIDQDMAVTVEEAAIAAGKLSVSLFGDDEPSDNDANKSLEQSNQEAIDKAA